MKHFNDVVTLSDMLKGVYLIYNTDKEIIYIGKSCSSIKNRLISHFKKHADAVYFSMINLVDCEEIEKLEKELIVRHMPKHNFQIKQTQELFIKERKRINRDTLKMLDKAAKAEKRNKHEIISDALALYFEQN